MIRKFASLALARALRPVDFLKRLVMAGLLAAIIVAGVAAMLSTLKISRECDGAFSAGFSAGFGRYHCELGIRTIRGGIKLRIPLTQ